MHRLPDREQAVNVSTISNQPTEDNWTPFKVPLRMVQPKYGIIRGVGNVAHVTPIADKTMNGVMDVFYIIISTAAAI